MARVVIKENEINVDKTPRVIDSLIYLSEEERQARLKPKETEEDENLRKIQKIKAEFEEWKRNREEEIKTEVKTIVDKAEQDAFTTVKKSLEESESIVANSDDEINSIVAEAEQKAEVIIDKAYQNSTMNQDKNTQEGYNEGKKDGFKHGLDSSELVIRRMNNVLARAIQKRSELVEEANHQLLQLILLTSRIVIRNIIEQEPRVVYDNIVDVLKHFKGRAEVIIRVNTEDLRMVGKHKKEFLMMIEGIEQLRIVEDNSVDRGGCIIDTDFGSVDARIAIQVTKIEELVKKNIPLTAFSISD